MLAVILYENNYCTTLLHHSIRKRLTSFSFSARANVLPVHVVSKEDEHNEKPNHIPDISPSGHVVDVDKAWMDDVG